MRFTSKLFAAALCCVLATPALAQQITGAGSTFVYPILSKWSDAYSKSTGVQVNYQSIGSGGGIAQIKAATVDFGASDAPLAPDQLDPGWPRAVSRCHRRRGPGCATSKGSMPGSFASPDRSSPTSISARSRNGMTRPSSRSIPDAKLPDQADHRGASLRWLGHHVQLGRTTSPRSARNGRTRSA